MRLTTDASSHGWGCLLGDQVTGADRWDPVTAKRHINVKELLAVQQALRLHLPQLADRRVLLLTDNTTVCHILATGTTRSQELLPILRDTWRMLLEHGVDLHCRFIPIAENPADAPSRRPDIYGQQLLPALREQLEERWGPHEVDRFADSANAQLPAFHAFLPTPAAVGTPDAFTNDWGAQRSWLYPPFPLVGRALRHLRECKGWGTLIAPAWPNQAWWPLLLEQAREVVDLNVLGGVEDPALLHLPSPLRNWFTTHPPDKSNKSQHHHTWHLLAFSLDFRHPL